MSDIDQKFIVKLRDAMFEQGLVQKSLAARAGVSISTISRALNFGKISQHSLIKIEKALGTRLSGNVSSEVAPYEYGGYSRASFMCYEGEYICVRPLFTDKNKYEVYCMSIEWDTELSCLVFREHKSDRPSDWQHSGTIYIAPHTPCLYFLTSEHGSLRMMMMSASQITEQVYGGLLTTLANPAFSHFIPASTKMIFARTVGKQFFSPKVLTHTESGEFSRHISILEKLGAETIMVC